MGNINFGILISILIIAAIDNEELFYIASAFYAVLELLFIVFWIYSFVKWLINEIKNILNQDKG